MSRIWNTWLPGELAQRVADDEPARFKAVSAALCAEVQRSEQATDGDRWHRVLRYIRVVNNFLSTKSAFAVEDVRALAESLWRVVLKSTFDLEAQVRCATTLTDLIRTHKHELVDMELPWRPLYDLLQELYTNPSPRLEGMGLTTTRQTSLFRLTTKVRRFFPPAAAAELWDLLQPSITGSNVAASYEALGWLSLLMPTHKLNWVDEAQLNRITSEWLEAWKLVVHNPQWDAAWLGIIARSAKHDTRGVIDWAPQVPRIFTHILGIFNVPVGNATGAVPVSRPAPYKAMLLFMNQMTHEPYHAARAAVHLLKHNPQRPDHQHPVLALTCLEQLVALLEQYFHPSNNGKWCRPLATLLKHLTHGLVKLLGQQAGAPPAGESRLSAEAQERLVAVLVKLAGAAQFSKDEHLSKVSVRVLASLAYLSPGTVIPLVVQRFRVALETATATHQLASAVKTMALCVRPMLLSGWPGQEVEPAQQLLVEAIMAVLPGIDANDEAKTTAVFHFYTAVLSSLPRVPAEDEADGPGLPYRLPLYWDEWADEVMSRTLTLLRNLDTGPGHRADQAHHIKGDGGGGSFLMQGAAVYWRLADLLFHKLPRPTAERLAGRLSSFALNTTLPGVATEVSTLINSFATYLPELADKLLVQPLLQRILAELPDPGLGPVSQTLESTLQGQVGVLREALAMRDGNSILPLMNPLTELVDRLLGANSKPLHNQGSGLLSVLCHLTGRYHCQYRRADEEPAPQLANGIERWVDKEGVGYKSLSWTIPTPEQQACGELLVAKYLRRGADDLRRLTAAGAGEEGSHRHKLQMHAALCKLRGTLNGFLSNLRDFQFSVGEAAGATPISVIGFSGPTPAGTAGTREFVAEALVSACRSLAHGGDAETLSQLTACAGLLLCNGTPEFAGSSGWRTDGRLDSIAGEPPIAAAYQDEEGPWRKRMPAWVAMHRCSHHLSWRSSQQAFRWWATSAAPEMPSTDGLPAPFKDLLFEVSQFATHGYKLVREEALPIVEAVLKRFPVLAPAHLPTFLAALADLPAPAADEASRQQVLARLADSAAALTVPQAASAWAAAGVGVDDGNGAAAAAMPGTAGGSASAPGVDSERDGRVIGACRMLQQCLPFWRIMFRDPDYFAATLRAFMSSRSHNSSPAQGAIGGLLVQLASEWAVHPEVDLQGMVTSILAPVAVGGRFVHPPALRYTSLLYSSLIKEFIALGSPTGTPAANGSPAAASAAATPAAVLAAAPGAAAAASGATWRYALMANVMVLMMMPHAGEEGAAAVAPQFTAHLLRLLGSDMLALRELGADGLHLQLSAVFEYGHANSAVVEVVSQAVESEGFGNVLFHLLSHGHMALETAEATKDKRGGGLLAMQSRYLNMRFEDMITRIMRASIERLARWPDSGFKPVAISEGLFVPSHARFIHVLALAAPSAMAAALRAPLEQRVTGERLQVSNTSDKAEQASCAEAVAGLLAANALVGLGGGADGADAAAWVIPLLDAALRSTTLELAGCWAVAVRYGVKGLLDSAVLSRSPRLEQAGAPRVAHLPQQQALVGLEVLLGSVRCSAGGQGGGMGALPGEIKRLKYLQEVVKELAELPASSQLPPQVLLFWSGVLEELRQLAASPENFSLREPVGDLLADVFAYFRYEKAELKQYRNKALHQEGGTVPKVGSVAGSRAVTTAANGGVGAPEVKMADAGAKPATAHATTSELECQTRQLASQLFSNFHAASSAVQALRTPAEASSASNGGAVSASAAMPSRDNADGAAGDVAVASAAPMEAEHRTDVGLDPNGISANGTLTGTSHGNEVEVYTAPVYHLALGLQYITSVVMKGDMVGLRDTLLALLPDLFRLQELAGPILQKLHKEAQVAFILLKYVLLDEAAVPTVLLGAATGTATAELWSTRAAGLVFYQYVWFRHALLLTPEQHAELQLYVVGRLSDPKAEVRAVAAATLSGMLKGTPAPVVGALRARLVAAARELFQRRPAAARTAGVPLLERLGCIQGLKAFVMSSPYDCPGWMPDVLMALVSAASSQEPALKAESSKALGEFRRTHEQDSLAQLRSMLEPDQWDALQQVSSTASYFA